MANKKRQVFYLSDRTAKTAEAVGQSLLSQFGDYDFDTKMYAFVSSDEKVNEIACLINQAAEQDQVETIVINTIVNPAHQKIISKTNACVIDLFGRFISPLEKSLGALSSYASGITHEKFEFKQYDSKIEAIDFTLAYDDGLRTTQYHKADIILIGVSRSGKSPTCIYLAMNFSIKAANYPLTEEELASGNLPEAVLNNIDKVVGLSIAPKQLYQIRQKRMPNTKYADFQNCQREISMAEEIFNEHQIPYLESTATSIEEIAVQLLKLKKLI